MLGVLSSLSPHRQQDKLYPSLQWPFVKDKAAIAVKTKVRGDGDLILKRAGFRGTWGSQISHRIQTRLIWKPARHRQWTATIWTRSKGRLWLATPPPHPTTVLILIRKHLFRVFFAIMAHNPKHGILPRHLYRLVQGNRWPDTYNPAKESNRLVTSTPCSIVLLAKIKHGDHTGWLQNAMLFREKAP